MSEEIEVVGFRYRSLGKHWELDDESLFSENVDCKSVAEEQQMLMTVAQHNRIVERYKRDSERMMGALMDIEEETSDHGAALTARYALNLEQASGSKGDD